MHRQSWFVFTVNTFSKTCHSCTCTCWMPPVTNK